MTGRAFDCMLNQLSLQVLVDTTCVVGVLDPEKAEERTESVYGPVVVHLCSHDALNVCALLAALSKELWLAAVPYVRPLLR